MSISAYHVTSTQLEVRRKLILWRIQYHLRWNLLQFSVQERLSVFLAPRHGRHPQLVWAVGVHFGHIRKVRTPLLVALHPVRSLALLQQLVCVAISEVEGNVSGTIAGFQQSNLQFGSLRSRTNHCLRLELDVMPASFCVMLDDCPPDIDDSTRLVFPLLNHASV